MLMMPVQEIGAASATKPCKPLHALNPYSNDWTIKDKAIKADTQEAQTMIPSKGG